MEIRIRHMVLVLLGVCLVCLAGVILEASSEKHVIFPTTIPTDQSSPADFLPISVKVSRAAIGQTKTVGTRRGGQATTAATNNSTEGFVVFRKIARTLTATATASATHAAKPEKPKRPVKRMSSIGAPGEPPASSGLAGGAESSASSGEHASEGPTAGSRSGG